MSHANAALTPRARLRLARLIVDHGWPPARAAERYDVSWKTAYKWDLRRSAERPERRFGSPAHLGQGYRLAVSQRYSDVASRTGASYWMR